MQRTCSLAMLVCFATSAAPAQGNWTLVDRPTDRSLRALEFADPLHGWVAGNEGTLLRTTDGGATWTVLDPGLQDDIVDVCFFDTLRGWALAHQIGSTSYKTVIMATTDGGLNWSRTPYPEVDVIFNSVTFLSPTTGWMAGEGGAVVGTTDGGLTWHPAGVDSTFAAWSLRRIAFVTPSLGFAVGGNYDIATAVWRTTDGGSSWRVWAGPYEPMNDLHAIDSLKLLAVGGDFDFGSAMIRSNDGGTTWEYTYLGIWGEARALGFRTSDEGWVPLGFAGTCMLTRDRGDTWRAFYPRYGTAMYDIEFIDSTHGFMVGSGGTILRFEPGGSTTRTYGISPGWSPVSLPLELPNQSASWVYPKARSPVFRFDPVTGYTIEDTLRAGRGYWVKFGGGDSITFSGDPVIADTIPLAAGWNLVGGLSTEIDTALVTTVPPGIRSSEFFAFQNGYIPVPALIPGKGYWVKATQSGSMILGGAAARAGRRE